IRYTCRTSITERSFEKDLLSLDCPDSGRRGRCGGARRRRQESVTYTNTCTVAPGASFRIAAIAGRFGSAS
ncbi:MAG TPA: hypothetical protein VE687_08080, partial [Stellaceae bacterium]|nr:hypothetical protein [Stellaceae bacterium]